jgi:Tfp pilus assembly protein PilE
MLKKFFKQFRYGEKGFILSELLVNVVAVFGVLSAVAVPNASNFIEQGKVESYETELHNITTEIMEILADRAADALDGDSDCYE